MTLRRSTTFAYGGKTGWTAGLTTLVTLAIILAGFICTTSWAMTPTGEKPDGQALYESHCAKCHGGKSTRAARLEILHRLPAKFILHSLELGKMKFQGVLRSNEERRAISEWVTGKKLKPESATDETVAGFCVDAPGEFLVEDGAPQWNGWGVDAVNSRFQPTEHAGVSADQVPKLKVKWVFGLPMDYQTSQPTVVGGRVFVGTMKGRVYSIDAKTGCLYWSMKPKSGVRSTLVIGQLPGSNPPRYVVYFGDSEARMYALDAGTGKELWQTRIDDHPMARITGTPKLHGNRLYVPITALEEAAGADADYECCTFRGTLVAMNPINGKTVWKTYTIPDAPAPYRKNRIGTQLWGPSGASVWSSPTLDLERGRMYVTTGDNYSDPASLTSDAMMAFDLRTGKFLWSQQFTPNDAFNIGCETADDTNCPEADGPDLDFGSSSILAKLPNGKRVLLAGQKSGVVHAVDPDRDGEILWQQRIGKGGLIGGIQWGPAADAKTLYVALSDIGVETHKDEDLGWTTTLNTSVGGGMFAFDIETGEQKWYTPPPDCGDRKACSPAQSAAISVIPGVVFSGSVDGHLRAYSTSDGTVVWDYNADQEYESTNGVKTRGGSFDGPGPTIVDGMVYVNSGYGYWGGMPGNALMAFSVDEE